jgi:outer membrane cobalamin receptor
MLVTNVVFSQNKQIGVIGILIDSTIGTPVKSGLITVKDSAENRVLAKITSDSLGRFNTMISANQFYTIVFSASGYHTKLIRTFIKHSDKSIQLGNISLDPFNHKSLRPVEIRASKPLVKITNDKIIYNVQSDPDRSTSSALDILRKAPLITIDANDNIKLKGTENYKVFVNGKPSSLFTLNAKDAFKVMPANLIKSIEIITNPSSKYDAEGIGGIINIVTYQANLSGYSGNLNLTGTEPAGYTASGYLTAKVNKLGFSGLYGYSKYTLPAILSDVTREDMINNRNIVKQNGSLDATGDFHFVNTEVSYALDSNNTFIVNANFNVIKSFGNYINNIHSLDQNQYTLENYNRLNTGDFKWLGGDAGMDYQHNFKRSKDQLLTFSYRLLLKRDTRLEDYINIPLVNKVYEKQKANYEADIKEHTFQIDYVQPFKKNSFETGFKLISRNNKSKYDYFTLNEQELYLPDLPLSNQFDYHQDIYSFYSSLNIKRNKWDLKIGGRIEKTLVNAQFISSGTNARQDYLQFIPSINLSHSINDRNVVKIAYSQRLERPSLYFLNPYIDQNDPKNLRYGNPDLDPAVTDVFDLSYNTIAGKSSFLFSLYYSFTNNSIQQYTFLGTESVSRTTYDNIGKDATVGGNVFANVPLNNKVSFTANLSGGYKRIESFIADDLVRNSGINYNATGSLSFSTGDGIKTNLNVGYYSRSIQLQSFIRGNFTHGISFSKPFLKNKFTASLACSNPFQKNNHSYSETTTPQFILINRSAARIRRFNLSLNYKFGELSNAVIKKKRGIVNDDLKEDPKK